MSKQISPRDFMRARRPDLYSDSLLTKSATVDVAFLDFALAQVTERKDEIAFEHFCRKLAEKEICPNLIPQTGPTGGGDSKVDSETYPVSELISERWYVGNPLRASTERWAFAFSAKQDWRSKIRLDVKKIVETGREYKKIFFMTNQQVSDRNRAEIEDKLSTEGNFDIRVFDRNWIANRILTNKHFALFESTLQVNLNALEFRRLGPEDAARESMLQELDDQISDTDRYVGVRFQLAEDCLETALLSRGLERPREETEARFDRAERIAGSISNHHQLVRILYHRAWTAACWYEDFEEFFRLYKSASIHVLGHDNIWNLERLVILWQIGTTLKRDKSIVVNEEHWLEHTRALKRDIGGVVESESKPTSSLMARTLLASMAMTEKQDHETVTKSLKEIASVLETALSHPDYPFDTTARVVEEVINIRKSNESLDDLLERIIAMQGKRCGKAQEGNMRLRRAMSCLREGRHSSALTQAGMAQLLLAHGGDDDGFWNSLVLTAWAYEALGLLWAARANFAFALHWKLRESDTTGKLSASLYIPLSRMIWLDLQLGRPSLALCWIELHRKLLNAVDLSEVQIESLALENQLLDAVLAIVVLRTTWSESPVLGHMPGVLEDLGMTFSALAATFMLGHKVTELASDDPDHVFTQLLRQPAAEDVSDRTDWGTQLPSILTTKLFGCRIKVFVHEGCPSLHLGETILAFLESMLATFVKGKYLFSARDQLSIDVVARDEAKSPFEYELAEDNVGEISIVVSHPNLTQTKFGEEHIKHFLRFFAEVLGQLWLPVDKNDLESLFVDERAPDRAGITAQLPLILDAVFGSQSKVNANSWKTSESKIFPLIRRTPWSPLQSPPSSTKGQSCTRPNFKDKNFSNSPNWGVDGVRHRDTKVLSIINLPLWDTAGWFGLGFEITEDQTKLPEMYFLFKDFEAGLKIFRSWVKKFGNIDENDSIGITIVTGIDNKHPDWYKVVVGYRETENLQSESQLLGFVSRIHEMNPTNSNNLTMFLQRYDKQKKYRISPVEYTRYGDKFVITRKGDHIDKQILNIVPACNIGDNELLTVALDKNRTPVAK